MTQTTVAPSRAFHRVAALAATALAALGLTLASAAPALAHDELVGVSGEVSSSDDSKYLLTLQFNNNVMDIGSELVATSADGTDLIDGAPTVSGRDVIQSLLMPAKDEAVSVAWRVVSSDGHPIQGTVDVAFAGADTAVAISGEGEEAHEHADEEGHEHAEEDGHEHAHESEGSAHEHDAAAGEQDADADAAAAQEGVMTTQDQAGTGMPAGAWIAIAVLAVAVIGAGVAAIVVKQKRAGAPGGETATGADTEEKN